MAQIVLLNIKMQSEDKQTRTSEFGPEKGFIAELWKENVWLMLKKTKLPNGFGGRVFIGNFGVRAAACMIFF